MPKIIKNLKEQLVTTARAQLSSLGYSGMTVRSVAAECGVGIGTVYNYFENKDALVAAVMIEDWHECLSGVERSKTARDTLYAIHRALIDFAEKYSAVFQDPEAHSAFSAVQGERHKQLRDRLAAYVIPFIAESDEGEAALRAAVITESLMTHTLEGVDFRALYPVISKLL